MSIQRLIEEMMAYYSGDPGQVQHLLKVHAFARLIGLAEGLDSRTQEVLEMAAVVHDIGIKPAREKHGSGSGKLQELEGPPVARKLLEKLGYPEEIVRRVCYLVGHHHSYQAMDGPDYQILVEADFLVNFYEGGVSPDAVQSALQTIFRTETGKRYCRVMFAVEE